MKHEPLFSLEALGEFNTKPKQHSRQWSTNSYVVKSEGGTDEKGVGTQVEKRLENCQLCNRHHDLDECKAFNNMVVAERSKFLAKQVMSWLLLKYFSKTHNTKLSKKKNMKDLS